MSRALRSFLFPLLASAFPDTCTFIYIYLFNYCETYLDPIGFSINPVFRPLFIEFKLMKLVENEETPRKTQKIELNRIVHSVKVYYSVVYIVKTEILEKKLKLNI